MPETGLYYYKARFYSPTLGRFMQTDPIGYGDGMNMYAYVGNDPVNGTDPTGMADDGGIVVTGQRPSFDICQAACLWSLQGVNLMQDGRRPDGSVQYPVGATSITIARGKGQSKPAKPRPKHKAQRQYCGRAGCHTDAFQDEIRCVGSALWNNKGVLALDVVSVGASFVPGGKGVVTAAAAAVGSTTGVAALGIGVANRDIPGAAIGAAGHYVSMGAYLLEGAKGLASNLPVAGQAIAIGGALYDGYNAIKEGGCLGSKK